MASLPRSYRLGEVDSSRDDDLSFSTSSAYMSGEMILFRCPPGMCMKAFAVLLYIIRTITYAWTDPFQSLYSLHARDRLTVYTRSKKQEQERTGRSQKAGSKDLPIPFPQNTLLTVSYSPDIISLDTAIICPMALGLRT